MSISSPDRNLYRYKPSLRVIGWLCAILLSASVAAQYPNPDVGVSFARDAISGTARSTGAGGAFSSVGADLGSMDLNPAGMGLFHSSDICITPGIRVGADQSNYDGGNMNTSHTILEIGQAGAAFNIKPKRGHQGAYALRSVTLGINYQMNNSFDRVQNFNVLSQPQSIINRYAEYSNAYGTSEWSIEAQAFNQAGILGQNAGGTYTSNVNGPVHQTGNLTTSGGSSKIDLGFGADFGGKLFFGASLGIPIINYSLTTQLAENGLAPDSVTHFSNYLLTSVVSETGAGVTGKVGLIYKPAPWVRFGVAYSLPTWLFLSETYNIDLVYTFDTMQQGSGELSSGNLPVTNYQLRTPMKGTFGASFYYKEYGFISVDYDIQNLGSTHYHFTDATYASLDTVFNPYLKSTYGYSHTVRVGIEGVIKKFRIRGGYSYTNSPFKAGQNYSPAYSGAVQRGTVGVGFMFKHFFIDAAYILSYTKDAVSPYSQIPLDPINSSYITHNVLLTVGIKIGSANNDSNTAKEKHRSSDELPKFIDPGDKY